MRTTVCLNMIVKNEAKIIRRCLDSVRPFIDHWVIVDTGSSDGTQDLIRDCFRDIPGTLYQRPWKHFGHNRSEAIALAEGTADFVLLTDADMVLKVHDAAWRPDRARDGYYVRQYRPGRYFSNVRLVNGRHTGDKRWCYRCATHEYIDSVRSELNTDLAHADAISFVDVADGGSKVDKYERDAGLLETELSVLEAEGRALDRTPSGEPGLDPFQLNDKLHQRTMVYLAQTYRDAEQPLRALETYRRRADMGGWDEEVWYSLFQVAELSEVVGRSDDEVRAAYMAAFDARPTRSEPLVALAAFERRREQWGRAHLYARYACELTTPDDLLFIDRAAYRWRRYDEMAVAAYWLGRYSECALVNEKLLGVADLPDHVRARVADNLRHAQARIEPLANDGPEHDEVQRRSA